jgi:hypothetical protein
MPFSGGVAADEPGALREVCDLKPDVCFELLIGLHLLAQFVALDGRTTRVGGMRTFEC